MYHSDLPGNHNGRDRRCSVFRLVRVLAGMSAAVGSLASGCSAGSADVSAARLQRTLKLQQIDGTPNYYARFKSSLPTSPAFFPIGVWLGSVLSPADTRTDRAAGLNTYVGLTRNSNLSFVAASGMHALLQQNEWLGDGHARESAANVGWLLADEVDMTGGPYAGPSTLAGINQRLPKDGRMRYANYGKGVAFWETTSQASRFVNGFQDVVSDDNYWFTDEDLCEASQGGQLLGIHRALSPAECHRAANYGATVTRLRSLVSPARSKPVWGVVEVGHPASEDSWPSITSAEVRAAVWQSLIAGARGIIYFDHSFGGPHQTYSALRDPSYASVRSAVTTTDRQIRALAPVLNAPNVVSGWTHGSGATAMTKWWRRHFYVFAGSGGAAVTGSFSIPCVGNATAKDLTTSRTIPITNGRWRDRFADGNAVHIYRIDGESSCGLG